MLFFFVYIWRTLPPLGESSCLIVVAYNEYKNCNTQHAEKSHYALGVNSLQYVSPPRSHVSNYLFLFEADIFEGRPAFSRRTLLPFF